MNHVRNLRHCVESEAGRPVAIVVIPFDSSVNRIQSKSNEEPIHQEAQVHFTIELQSVRCKGVEPIVLESIEVLN